MEKSIVVLIHHLLEYEKDAFFCYKSARKLPPAINRRVKEEQGRHERGLQIPSNVVQKKCSKLDAKTQPLKSVWPASQTNPKPLCDICNINDQGNS